MLERLEDTDFQELEYVASIVPGSLAKWTELHLEATLHHTQKPFLKAVIYHELLRRKEAKWMAAQQEKERTKILLPTQYILFS